MLVTFDFQSHYVFCTLNGEEFFFEMVLLVAMSLVRRYYQLVGSQAMLKNPNLNEGLSGLCIPRSLVEVIGLFCRTRTGLTMQLRNQFFDTAGMYLLEIV